MRISGPTIFAAGLLLLMPGCIARTLVNVATAPVQVISKAADLATTSQSEADEKRGRELRQTEQHLGRLERDYRQHVRQCGQGRSAACAMADEERAELDRCAQPDFYRAN